MAIPEKLFRDGMMAASGVTDLIGQRAYFMEAPQGTTTPYAIITMVSNVRAHTIDTPDTLPNARIQVDVIAEDVEEMGNVREAIRSAMNFYTSAGVASCRLENDFTQYDRETEYPRAILEYRLTYLES